MRQDLLERLDLIETTFGQINQCMGRKPPLAATAVAGEAGPADRRQ